MKVVLIKNIVYGGERKIAGDIVDLEDKIAKEFLKADLAAVYGEIKNGEVIVDANPEVLEEAEAAPEQEAPKATEAAPEQEAPKATATAKKTSGKAKK